MPRKKRKKMAELASLPNAFEGEAGLLPGWYHAFFGNQDPVTVELGCGWGEYSIALARRFPQRNFIGVDVKGARLWKAATTALEQGVSNVAFLRVYADRLLQFFEEGEVEEIWLPFPDPFPKPSRARHRLTSPKYLALYRKLLRPEGRVHLKTDDPGLYAYTLETVREAGGRVLVAETRLPDLEDAADPRYICTKYERLHREKGKAIRYLCFAFV